MTLALQNAYGNRSVFCIRRERAFSLILVPYFREEETYSDKTPSSQLVEVAKIASGYRGKPEVLMKVIIQAQKKMRKRR